MYYDMLELNLLLIKIYMFVLFTFMLINDYCNTRIKQMKNKRKAYNLLSKVIEVDLSDEEARELLFIMNSLNITDVNKYLRQMLFK